MRGNYVEVPGPLSFTIFLKPGKGLTFTKRQSSVISPVSAKNLYKKLSY